MTLKNSKSWNCLGEKQHLKILDILLELNDRHSETSLIICYFFKGDQQMRFLARDRKDKYKNSKVLK